MDQMSLFNMGLDDDMIFGMSDFHDEADEYIESDRSKESDKTEELDKKAVVKERKVAEGQVEADVNQAAEVIDKVDNVSNKEIGKATKEAAPASASSNAASNLKSSSIFLKCKKTVGPCLEGNNYSVLSIINDNGLYRVNVCNSSMLAFSFTYGSYEEYKEFWE